MMRFGGRLTILSMSVFCVCSTISFADNSCEISNDKKRAIYSVLCGQESPEPPYQFSGPNCVVKSATKRIEDAAIQIYGYHVGSVNFPSG
jgi:hypothetical protein